MRAAVFAVAFLLAPGLCAAAAPTAAPGVNETCLMCHGARRREERGRQVDRRRRRRSSHRRCTASLKLECTACHADVSAQKIPHAEKLKPVNCATCHEQPVKEYAATVHGKARKDGNDVAATCTDCHGTHDILQAKNPASRTNHANVEATCSRCHGDDATMARASSRAAASPASSTTASTARRSRAPRRARRRRARTATARTASSPRARKEAGRTGRGSPIPAARATRPSAPRT